MKPEHRAIKVDLQGKGYMSLLGGPPESMTMKSGAISLQPGQCVGKHNTGDKEEILVVLEGEGTLVIGENKRQKMSVDTVQYIPPETDHDVINTGPSALRYIYVTAKTR